MARTNGSYTRDGFTLVEAVLSILIVGMMSTVIGGLFLGALQASAIQSARLQLQGQVRSAMESAMALDFDQINSTSSVVAVEGVSYTVQTVVIAVDMDADTLVENDAKQITVSIQEASLSLTALVVNTTGKFGAL